MVTRAAVSLEMNEELRTGNLSAFRAIHVKVVAGQSQLLQFSIQLMRVEPEVHQSAEKHVATDTAKNIEIKGFHESSPAARALI